MNYIYGTWSALCALRPRLARTPSRNPFAGLPNGSSAIQNSDGGWGESGKSYRLDYKGYETVAEHGFTNRLGAARADGGGGDDHPAVARGVAYLVEQAGRRWVLEGGQFHTATGFPRVFYLRYHGYSKFFPLWALARYRNLKRGNSRAAVFGM